MVSPPPDLGARFHVEDVLTDGPFERCYRARDAVLQRDVMLKLPAREALDAWTAPVRERLLREARALARIRHPNIAPIHHVEETREGPLLVLDLPRGETLAERLRSGPLPVDETIAIARQLGDALAHVHQQSVVHRAVGPSTVRILANGQVELGSFTFAKEFLGARGTSLVNLRGAASSAAARAQHLPEYPAPEQLTGQSADPRVDVFALGCTMFRCLAGYDPFPPGSEHTSPPDLRVLQKDVGRPLAEVLRKCMAFAKSARYATAREVVDALATLPAAAPRRGWRTTIATIGAVALLGTVWFVGDSWARGPVRGGSEVTPSANRNYEKSFAGHYRRVHGLFIAIGTGYSDPQWTPLVNPRRDVDAIVQQLQANDPAWRSSDAVRILPDRDATKARICEELMRLKQKDVVDENDAVLVWFAGHGAKHPRKFALCASDASGDVVGGGDGYLDDEVLQAFGDDCPAKHVLFVLDCCHAGAAFESEPRSPMRGAGREAESAVPPPGEEYRRSFSREYLCSAGPEQRAADGQTMSPFTAAVLAQLRATDKAYVPARYLASRVEEAMEHTGSRLLQVPKFATPEKQHGSFVFMLQQK